MFFPKRKYFSLSDFKFTNLEVFFFSKIGFGYCLGPPRRSFFRFEPLWVISLLSDHQLTPTERYPDTTRWVLFTISIQFLLGPILRYHKTFSLSMRREKQIHSVISYNLQPTTHSKRDFLQILKGVKRYKIFEFASVICIRVCSFHHDKPVLIEEFLPVFLCNFEVRITLWIFVSFGSNPFWQQYTCNLTLAVRFLECILTLSMSESRYYLTSWSLTTIRYEYMTNNCYENLSIVVMIR